MATKIKGHLTEGSNLHLLILKTSTKWLDRFSSNLVGMYPRVGNYISLSLEVEVKGQE
ncbi:hypothetical protein HOLleu_39703 [Holothuria leucospilota]|uniref:Uncharacterized protein n=1 Tax=Holothuria leucospilota TaxID=206669 RepID=A0A9Q1BB48_HOLLE|nr:hypothetical protein HOLleu_39703 [Holothuria leucospilota]